MRKPGCAECEQLFQKYSTAVFEHVKVDGRMKMAQLRPEVTVKLSREHRTAAQKREEAQRWLKEHEATHADGTRATGMA